jgi:alpha-1,2-mannosyltransferase
MGVRPGAARLQRWPWLPGTALAVFALAFAARLVPVLRGGGLSGLDSYDDGVHFSAALALVNGRLPYRDFLFLHPPGVILALSPFAELGALTRDGWGFAAGRIAWMLMGSATAALIVIALRHVGWLGALVGGIGYAVYLPAVRTERTTMLEGLTSFLLIVALVSLGSTRLRARHPGLIFMVGGVLLGMAAGVKIWGVVVVVVVAGWVAVAYGVGKALRMALGTVLGVSALCLPFFLAAPAAMWRMVVFDQLARPENGVAPLNRLAAIVGLPDDAAPDPRLVIAAVVALTALVLIALTRDGKVAPLLVLAMAAVVLLSPSFYLHYPASFAVPLALSAGTAAAAMQDWAGALGRLAPRLLAGASVAVLIVLVAPMTQFRSGQQLPVAALSAAIAQRPGCVTSDDPTILVEFDVFSRNIARGCGVVVDLTGYSYDISAGVAVSRTQNVAFQDLALGYLSSGDVTAAWRLRAGWGYSRRTVAELQRWPVLAAAGTYLVRQPLSTTDHGR